MHIPSCVRIFLFASLLPVLPVFPAPAPTVLGVNDHILYRTPAEHEVAFAAYRDSDTRFLRINIDWITLEPAQGVYSKNRLENLDRFFALAEKSRIRVMASVAYAPSWANGGKQGAGWPPTDNERYADFCEWFVRRYGQVKNAAGERVLEALEIWNEPDLCDLFFKGYPRYSADAAKAYAELVKVAGGRLRAIRADAGAADLLVCAPAISNIHSIQWAPAGQKTWADTFYGTEGVTGCYDVVTLHSYWEHSGSTGWLPPELPACWDAGDQRSSVMGRVYFVEPDGLSLWERMKAAGDGNKEIWFTEIGGAARGEEPEHPARMLSLHEQKAHLKDALKLLRDGRMENLKRVYWYELFDEPHAKKEQRYYGLLSLGNVYPLDYDKPVLLTEAAFGKKPAYQTYKEAPKVSP
jgi:hypothetical protein